MSGCSNERHWPSRICLGTVYCVDCAIEGGSPFWLWDVWPFKWKLLSSALKISCGFEKSKVNFLSIFSKGGKNWFEIFGVAKNWGFEKPGVKTVFVWSRSKAKVPWFEKSGFHWNTNCHWKSSQKFIPAFHWNFTGKTTERKVFESFRAPVNYRRNFA